MAESNADLEKLRALGFERTSSNVHHAKEKPPKLDNENIVAPVQGENLVGSHESQKDGENKPSILHKL